jgi:hypothetical protein
VVEPCSTLETRYNGNNHQCNEFVTHTVKDLRICDLEHSLCRRTKIVEKCLKIDKLEWGKVSLGDGVSTNIYNGGDVIVAGTKF